MHPMDSDDKDVLNYLRSYGNQFVSAREIARRAGGKWRYRDNANWATPVLRRLVEMGILESDANRYYRIRPKGKKKSKKWISPQIRAILEKSGKDFGEVLQVDEADDLFK